jgi:hypothetical protein
MMPVFEVDTSWPSLPNQWGLGQSPSVAVDRHDNVWILHRPRTIADGKKPAPAVIELDAAGKFVNAWGGPGQGFDWPTASTESLSTTKTTCGSAAAAPRQLR